MVVPRRILYWTQLFRPYIGGVEIHTSHLLPELQKRGHECAIITSHGCLDLPDEDIYKGIPVYRFRFREVLEKRDIEGITDIRKKIDKIKECFRPDIVHIQLSDPSVFFHLQTLNSFPAPTIITIPVPLFERQIEDNSVLYKALGLADWIVTISKAGLKEVLRLRPDLAEKSSVVYHSLLVPSLKPQPLSFKPPIIFSWARHVPDKGLDLAIDAFDELISDYPDAKLIIGGDGPIRSDLEAQVKKLGIGHGVTFTGLIPEGQLHTYINNSTVVIVSSRWEESFGLTALEAAQMARPVVATRAGGLPEVVLDQITGMVVTKEDSQAMAAALRYLLRHPDKAVAFGQEARRRALDKFGWEQHIERHDELYRRIYKRWKNEFK